jgi:chitin synthase
MAFVSVMLVPILYYLVIPLWITSSWMERIQFWLGLILYVFCGPFICIAVLIYALWNMDSFGWGKTRKVVSTDHSSDSGDEHVNLSETASEVNKEVVHTQQPEVRVEDRMTEVAQEEKRVGDSGP